MRRLLILLTLIGSTGLSGCIGKGNVDSKNFNVADWEMRIKDPALSEVEFTRLYALRVAAEFEGAKVQIVGPREISLKLQDGSEIKLFLDNAWAEASADAGNRVGIIKRYLSSLKETRISLENENSPPDTNRIVPVIRDLRYAAYFTEIGQIGTNQVVSQPFAADLLVMFVEDREGNLDFLTEGDRLALSLSLPDLRSLAMANLKRLLPEVGLHDAQPVFFVRAGGNYESSLLLADSFWDKASKSVEGDVVAAVPARDWLIFTGSKSPDGIQKVRQLVARIEKDSSHLITSTLLVRRNARWEKFGD
jgi:uncharacterized protein YtpQ (UPF0354 family)